MPSLETIEDVVTAGVDAQARIDKHLARAYQAAEDLTNVTERGLELGMIQGIAAKAVIGDARSLQGMVGGLASAFAALHQTQTDASIAAGADLGSVTTAGGITIGGVSVMGGGR